jgi:hypothetical protein
MSFFFKQPADNIKCGVENKPAENCKDLVRVDSGGNQECEEKFYKLSTGDRLRESALPSKQGRDIGKELSTVVIRELRRNDHISPPRELEMQSTDQDSDNQFRDKTHKRNDSTLPELRTDDEKQYTQDMSLLPIIFSRRAQDLHIQSLENESDLLKLLRGVYSVRDDNTLQDYEIDDFSKVYGITDFCYMFSCNQLEFWLKSFDGTIYVWSRVDNAMIHGGSNMKEALKNYIFRHENLCYVNEYTHELVPIHEFDDEISESEFKYIDIEEIKQMEKESKKESKKGGIKKQQKNKQKKKKKNKKKKH